MKDSPYPEQTFREAGLAWMAEQNARLMRHLPGTLAGEDPEELHDMRVASRRLRAAMLLFQPVFPAGRYRKWYGRVSDIAEALGGTRDADVQLEAIARRREGLTPEEQADVDAWVEAHQARREDARVEMIKAVNAWRDRDMSGRLAAFLGELGARERLAAAAREAETALGRALEGTDG